MRHASRCLGTHGAKAREEHEPHHSGRLRVLARQRAGAPASTDSPDFASGGSGVGSNAGPICVGAGPMRSGLTRANFTKFTRSELRELRPCAAP